MLLQYKQKIELVAPYLLGADEKVLPGPQGAQVPEEGAVVERRLEVQEELWLMGWREVKESYKTTCIQRFWLKYVKLVTKNVLDCNC